MGFSPPGSFSDFLGPDPPAELEHFCTTPCAALSTLWHVVESASLSRTVWPSHGCSNKDCALQWKYSSLLRIRTGGQLHLPPGVVILLIELETVKGIEDVRETPHCV